MIFKIKNITYVLLFIFFSLSNLSSEEKFEGLIVSVDSEAITTYDLSERIKLVLKSLKLEDNIKNRDYVRDRVLELLILEKIKKIEAEKSSVEISDDELKNFISRIYDFPVIDYDKFKKFLAEENIDIDVVKEQLKSELLWKKFTRQKFSSKITINKNEVDRLIENMKNKVGKIEYNFSEIFFKNNKLDDWVNTKNRMNRVLTLLDSESSFDLIANKFDESISSSNLKKNKWVLESNLETEQKELLNNMNAGDIKSNIKTKNGYKILKLNKKRTFGIDQLSYSFIKFSSFDKNLEEVKSLNIQCNSEFLELDDISSLKLNNIKASEISEVFLNQLKEMNTGEFTDIIEISGEYNMLFICDKSGQNNDEANRNKIETKIFANKFNQLSNTFLTNLRKNANIKFFTK